MNRFILAIKCFFLVLFYRRLPAEAVELMPPPELKPLPAPAPEKVPETKPAPVEKKADQAERGAVRLLALLQREGRLVDFLEENIDSYQDAQIGAAVRDIHRGCKKALGEYLKLEPVLPQPEDSTVRIDEGFDPSRVRLVGEVTGAPPFLGTLRHAGWRAAEVKLPAQPEKHDPTVIAPAEVELGQGGGA